MKEVRHYVCDICHTEYADKQACKRCEESHVRLERIKGAHYLPLTQNGRGYPHKIDVCFEDGITLTYKR